MQRYYDGPKLISDLQRAVEQVLTEHGLGSTYGLLPVCAMLEVMASPLKHLIAVSPLTRRMGELGVEIYYRSHLPMRVALAQSPHSMVVNPMMEAMAAAVARHTAPLPDELLLRDTLRVFLDRPRLTVKGVPKALTADPSLLPAFGSAKQYLQEAEIIQPTPDGRSWALADGLGWSPGFA